MEWLINHWWIIVPIFLAGVIVSAVKDLMHLNYKKYLINKPQLPPHRDCNDKWDDDDDGPQSNPPKK